MPIADMFWGDRVGQVKDPFGYMVTVSNVWELTPEEMKEKEKEWLKQSGM